MQCDPILLTQFIALTKAKILGWLTFVAVLALAGVAGFLYLRKGDFPKWAAWFWVALISFVAFIVVVDIATLMLTFYTPRFAFLLSMGALPKTLPPDLVNEACAYYLNLAAVHGAAVLVWLCAAAVGFITLWRRKDNTQFMRQAGDILFLWSLLSLGMGIYFGFCAWDAVLKYIAPLLG